MIILRQMNPIIIFLAGLGVIILGAEMVLRSASRMAALMGVKPILIGLTFVAIGTSAPELAVGITAASEGKGGLAVGNIAGTNMFNILFILGLSAAMRPMKIYMLSIKLDVPVMIGAALILIFFALDGNISPTEGGFLLAGAVVYTIALIRFSRKQPASLKKEYSEEFGKTVLFMKPVFRKWAWNIIMLLSGIGLTIVGADLLVDGAVSLAVSLGVSDAVIGLTIVAMGTSAPELVTTILATRKNDRDVAVGNLIGSSITNILVILGITCLVSPGGINVSREILWYDLPIAALMAVLCYPVFKSNRTVSRMEGILFLTAFIVYMGMIVLFRT